MTAAKKATKKVAKKAAKPAPAEQATKSPEDAAKIAAAAAGKGSDKPAVFERPDDTEGLSAAAKLAIQRSERNAQLEAEDEAHADEAIELVQVELMITRDNTRTTIHVFEYEEAVYEKIHKPENVDRIGERTVAVLDWNPEAAYDLMLRKFGKNGEKSVRAVYGNEAQLAREVGVKYKPTAAGKKRDRNGQGALQIDYSKPESVKDVGLQRVPRVVAR